LSLIRQLTACRPTGRPPMVKFLTVGDHGQSTGPNREFCESQSADRLISRWWQAEQILARGWSLDRLTCTSLYLCMPCKTGRPLCQPTEQIALQVGQPAKG